MSSRRLSAITSSSAPAEPRRHRRVGLALALIALVGLAGAEARGDANTAELARIEGYLNAIETLSARFVQIDDRDRGASGRIYVRRPGQLRLDYDPPMPIEIVSQGSWLVYYDRELEEVTYVPISSTPARFLLADNVALGGDVRVVGLIRTPSGLSVTLEQRDAPGDGSITLTFDEAPLALAEWEVVDAEGHVTRVVFDDLRLNEPVDPTVFDFVAPDFRTQP